MKTPASAAAVAQLGAVALAAVLAMAPAPPAQAQTFTEAIKRALDANCAGLKGSGAASYDGSLAGICAIPATTAGQSAGVTVTMLTTQQITAEERRVKERLKDARLALVTGETQAASADSLQLGRLGLFLSGEYERFEADTTRFATGHESDTKGVTFGADYGISKSVIAGIALHVSRTTGAFEEHGGSFATDAWGGMLYASILPLPSLFVDVTIGYAHKEYDQKRRTTYQFLRLGALNIVDGFAQGDTGGEEFRTSATSGYDFVLRNITVGPRVGVSYKHNTVDAFKEHGWQSKPQMDTGLELNYEGQHEDSLTTTLGLFASIALSTPIGVVVPQVTAEYVHEFMRDQRVVYFNFHEDFTRTRLRFQTAPPDRDYGNVGAGVSLLFPGGLAGFVNYRALVGYSGQMSHTATAGLRFAFQ
ncbi:MAG: autotransporter outer membrane beta-barrel domain-containing protein [candidate division NC10 bacterium]